MTTSIGKSSKSFLIKILVGIIILPFLFWGMGDVFRGGNQNVIATIDSEKISTKDFVNYLNRLNLTDVQVKNLPNTDLMEKVLAEYIGKKVMQLEIQDSNIVINDNSLRNIIKNEELFLKDKKFSRTKYEKFLLESGVTAPTFEKNISEQESKRQFLDFLAGGITIPDNLITKAFNEENQIKTIEFIDLNKYYENKKPTQKEIQEIYNKNKNSFINEFKSIQYSKITPQLLSGSKEFDENFFKQLDTLENNILDGQSYDEASKQNNLKTIIIKKVDSKKRDENKKKVTNLSDELFEKIYSIKKEKLPEVIKIENNYYLAEILSINKSFMSINEPNVQDMILAQINFRNKIKGNTSIAKDISMGGYNKDKMKKFASENNLNLKNYRISSLKQNEIFPEGIIKRIFLIKDGEINLITDSALTKNFLVLSAKTRYKKLEKDSDIYERYEAKARLGLVNKIYKTFDQNLNKKYKVELNNRTVERVKNSF